MTAAVKHPAKFSTPLLPVIAKHLEGYHTVLDPMAGVGHGALATHYNELEPEWATQCPGVVTVSDARHLPYPDGAFDAIATSPPYGNRMADKYDGRDGSRRNTYRTALGRPVTVGSAACLQWGEEYRATMSTIWRECVRVLRPGGRLVANTKDHVRKGVNQCVSNWTLDALVDLGLTFTTKEAITCPGNRHGQNGQARLDYEWVLVFDKPEMA